MAAKKKQRKPKELTLDDVVKLAVTTNLDPDVLDASLEDAADDERELILENVRSGGLRGRLEFLYMHGFSLERLAEIIRRKSDDLFADD